MAPLSYSCNLMIQWHTAMHSLIHPATPHAHIRSLCSNNMLLITGKSAVSMGRHCECSDWYWKVNDFKIYYHHQIFQQVELKILNLKANKKINSEKKLPWKVSKTVRAAVASSRLPGSSSTCTVWERSMYKASCKDPRAFQLHVQLFQLSVSCLLGPRMIRLHHRETC